MVVNEHSILRVPESSTFSGYKHTFSGYPMDRSGFFKPQALPKRMSYIGVSLQNRRLLPKEHTMSMVFGKAWFRT